MIQTRHGPDGSLLLPPRTIPLPSRVSQEARRFLATPSEAEEWPDIRDLDAVRAAIRRREERLVRTFRTSLDAFPARIETERVEAADLYHVTPEQVATANRERAILYVHGGAYIVLGGVLAGEVARPVATVVRCKVYSVDYRMPPDHPFPAALDDTVAAYRALLARYRPENITFMGSSAGGGLAAAAILKARDIGLPLPGAAILHTPEADLTESGDSFETNLGIDTVLRRRLTEPIALYAGGHDLEDPYLSPIFADFSRGFPPTMLSSGTRDLFLSNTVILHRALRRAGVPADLHVFEAMPHGGFAGAPEDMELLVEQARFLDTALGTGKGAAAGSAAGRGATSAAAFPATRHE